MKPVSLAGAFLPGVLAGVLMTATAAQTAPSPERHAEALDILTRSIGFKTVQGAGQTKAYAEYLKGLLVGAGFAPADIQIEPVAGEAWMTARYPGRDAKKKPILILAHMDVVEARREDWTRDPFTAVVEDGWIYGRGASDNKFDLSMVIATMTHLKRQGWRPGRDVILAFSGDEETQMATTRVLAERLKGAEFALNADSGGGSLTETGQPISYGLQAAEKTYADFSVTVTDPGGHSSRPTATNPIYRLSRALSRLDAYAFPVMSNEITRAAAAAAATNTPGPLGVAMKRFADDPTDAEAIATLSANAGQNGLIRTTCVTTMIEGGHAPNALPQRAKATINCRIFPGVPAESVRQTINEVLLEPTAEVARLDDGSVDSPASPLRPDVMAAVKAAVHARYPGLAVTPAMSTGATDSMHFRAVGVPSYGVGGMFTTPGSSFAHGLNEKAPVAAIDGALDHWESLLRTLAK